MGNKLYCLIGLILVIYWAPARADQTPPSGLRPLSGTVGTIDRGDQPVPIYLSRLDAALWLEEAQHTAGPYVVSIANSLEAMDEKDRAEWGERLLLRAYLRLASYAGPEAGRLTQLYVAALSQLLGVRQEEAEVTPELLQQLQQIGSYASAQAASRIAHLPGPERAEMQTQLLLALGRYGEASRQAQAWDDRVHSPISKAYRLGAQLLGGQRSAAGELWPLEREGGAVAALASHLSRQAAREALSLKLGRELQGAGVPAPVRKLAAGWRPGGKGKQARIASDQPLRAACQALLEEKAGVAAGLAADCAYLLVEGPGNLWARSELLSAAGPQERRLVLLDLVRNLGALLGLAGTPPEKDPAQRQRALDAVLRLIPESGLLPDEAGALRLVARITMAQKPGIPAELFPDVDRFLKDQGCSALALPFYLGRHAGDSAGQAAALRAALGRCGVQGHSADLDEALRLLSLSLMVLDRQAELPGQVLGEVAGRRGKEPGQGRFLLSLADAEAARLFSRMEQPGAEDLHGLQRRYEEANAALVSWDGSETKGRAEAQIATLLLRRHQVQPQKAPLLEEANAHLRWAQLLAAGDGAALAQALEVRVARELGLAHGKPLAPPRVDTGKLPEGAGRHLLSCELALTAKAAKDSSGFARYAAQFAGPPLPELLVSERPRLLPSLGVDEHLRVALRGSGSVIVLPRCSLR